VISFKTIVVIMLGATHCSAQEINIRGIVKDTSGIGISGAIVSLENAKITTMTGADGIFTLTGIMSIKPITKSNTMVASPIQIQHGKISHTKSPPASI
jgi:hypothetical protein